MSTEFDWFMVTMPIFAIVVYAIVMVGSMEKQPKFLESKQTENMVIWAFGALFAMGAIYAGWSMFVVFYELLSNLLTSCRFTNSFAKTTRRKCLRFLVLSSA